MLALISLRARREEWGDDVQHLAARERFVERFRHADAVSRLRQKIDKPFDLALIQTVRSAGYMLRSD